MEYLTNAQLVNLFREVVSEDRDGEQGYCDQPWYRCKDKTEGWIPTTLVISYQDWEDQMMMGREEPQGDIEGVIKGLPVGTVIVQPVYTKGVGVVNQHHYKLLETDKWHHIYVEDYDML